MALLRGEILAALLAAAAAAPAGRADRLPEDGAPREAPGGQDAEQARRILEQGGYQEALPDEPTQPEPSSFSLGPLAELVRILMWIGLAVAVVLAVAWVMSRVGGRTLDQEVDPGAGAPAPLEVPLESAQRLAAAGRFAEAIHLLLLETLAALSRAARLAPSLTSREIAARVPLPARAREALAGLVAAVEISRFGGAPAGERDYRACLARFHAFLETTRRGGPPAEGTSA